MRKEVTGWAAFDKESRKGLAISYGITNQLSLTEDPLKVDIQPTPDICKIHCVWFNDTHKNKKKFEIKKVTVVTEIRFD